MGGFHSYDYPRDPIQWVDPLGLNGKKAKGSLSTSPSCKCPDVKPGCPNSRHYKDYNQARNAALVWLGSRGFSAEKVNTGKFGNTKDKPIGMTSMDDKIGFRVEHDVRCGAHINTFNGKEEGPHFTFDSSENSVKKIQKHFDTPGKPRRLR